MKIIKKLLIINFILLSGKNTFAQSRHGIYGEELSQSIMISAGANYYFGDIEKVGIFSKYWINQINVFGQIGYEKNIYRKILRLRINLLGGILNGKKDQYSFKTLVLEPDLLLEYFPFTITKNKMCNCDKKALGLYMYGGAGLSLYTVNFNTYNKKIKYNSYAPMVALGVGYRFNITQRFELGLELGYRLALLANAADVSLDGYPFTNDDGSIVSKNASSWNDGFYTFGITAGYKF